MQGPLLQDHALYAEGEKLGRLTRLLEYDLETGRTREFVYPLDSAKLGVSEILELAPDRFLVLERDSKPGAESQAKRLHEAHLSGATDVSAVASLPADEPPTGVTPMRKSLFLDLLDERWGIPRDSVPAKIEGLAFGPRLADGRRVLIVCSDNDFVSTEPTWVYAFAVRD